LKWISGNISWSFSEWKEKFERWKEKPSNYMSLFFYTSTHEHLWANGLACKVRKIIISPSQFFFAHWISFFALELKIRNAFSEVFFCLEYELRNIFSEVFDKFQ
jgi:hypothetical protein